MRQCPRIAQALQSLGQPGAGDHLRPIGVFCRDRIFGSDIRAGEQPHGRAECQPIALSRAFDFAETLDHPFQLVAVDLDPLAAHQRQSIGTGEQFTDFLRRERLAIERDFHMEIEQRVVPDARGRLGAYAAGHAGTRRTIAVPRCGHPDDDTGRLQLRDIAQELQSFPRCPAEGMKYLALVDHRFQPGARLGGALYGQE